MENLDLLRCLVDIMTPNYVIRLALTAKPLQDKIYIIYSVKNIKELCDVLSYEIFKGLMQVLYQEKILISNLSVIKYYEQEHISNIYACFLSGYRKHKELIPSRLDITKKSKQKFVKDRSLFVRVLRYKNFRDLKDLCLKIPNDKLELFLSKLFLPYHYHTSPDLRPTHNALAHDLCASFSFDDKLDFIFLQFIYIIHIEGNLSIYRKKVIDYINMKKPN